MAFKFNPLTGELDLVGASTGSSITITTVLKSILLDSDPDSAFPVASILFDADSILFNDDGEL
jgi:hypothetical protein